MKKIPKFIQIFFCGLEKISVTRVSPVHVISPLVKTIASH